MDDEFFRNLFLTVAGPLLLIALCYRLRSRTAERLDRRQEGLVILFGLRLGAIPMVVGTVCWLIRPSLLNWSRIALPDPVRFAGAGLTGLGAALIVWTFHHLGKNLTDTVVTRRNHTLVTDGPYRFVRHPFYVAFLMMFIGESLVASNWFLLLAGALPFSLIVVRTRIEEEKLIERFGDAYRDYMNRTGRFWPR